MYQNKILIDLISSCGLQNEQNLTPIPGWSIGNWDCKYKRMRPLDKGDPRIRPCQQDEDNDSYILPYYDSSNIPPETPRTPFPYTGQPMAEVGKPETICQIQIQDFAPAPTMQNTSAESSELQAQPPLSLDMTNIQPRTQEGQAQSPTSKTSGSTTPRPKRSGSTVRASIMNRMSIDSSTTPRQTDRSEEARDEEDAEGAESSQAGQSQEPQSQQGRTEQDVGGEAHTRHTRQDMSRVAQDGETRSRPPSRNAENLSGLTIEMVEARYRANLQGQRPS